MRADSLQVYLKEIRDESLLTAAEECTLAEAIAQGGQGRPQSDDSSQPAVGRQDRARLRGAGMILEDLIGEGNLGLIRATEEFQPRFGTRFSTYAAYWIKQSIRHALINTTSTIRLPAHMVGLLTKWRRSERSLSRELGRTPTFSEVASHLELSDTQKYLLAKRCRPASSSLKAHPLETGWRSELGIRHCDESPHVLLETGDELDTLWGRIERLDAREQTILILRYGLKGESPLTLKEIGRRLGVTREWVRKIEIRAMRKLENRAGTGTDLAAKLPRSDRPYRTARQPTVDRRHQPWCDENSCNNRSSGTARDEFRCVRNVVKECGIRQSDLCPLV